MSAGQPVVPSGGGAAKPPDMSKNARGRNLALPEVLVACMAAGRANEECGESTVEVRGAAMARFFREYAQQLHEEVDWPVLCACVVPAVCCAGHSAGTAPAYARGRIPRTGPVMVMQTGRAHFRVYWHTSSSSRPELLAA